MRDTMLHESFYLAQRETRSGSLFIPKQLYGIPYTSLRKAPSNMVKRGPHNLGALLVLICQVLFLAAFGFGWETVERNRWMQAILAFSMLFGLILSLGFYGMWRKSKDDVDLGTFLRTNPIYLAVAIATVGEIATILLVPIG